MVSLGELSSRGDRDLGYGGLDVGPLRLELLACGALERRLGGGTLGLRRLDVDLLRQLEGMGLAVRSWRWAKRLVKASSAIEWRPSSRRKAVIGCARVIEWDVYHLQSVAEFWVAGLGAEHGKLCNEWPVEQRR